MRVGRCGGEARHEALLQADLDTTDESPHTSGEAITTAETGNYADNQIDQARAELKAVS
jgi:hypothetical protein